MKKILLCLTTWLICLLFYVFQTHAQIPAGGGTSTVEVIGDNQILHHDFYREFSLAGRWGGTITGHSGEYVYNEAGETLSTSGWVSVGEYTDGLYLEAVCPVLPNTGTITAKLYERIGSIGTGTEQYTITFGTSTPTTQFPIEEKTDWIRIGLNITAIPTNTEQVSIRLKGIKGKR